MASKTRCPDFNDDVGTLELEGPVDEPLNGIGDLLARRPQPASIGLSNLRVQVCHLRAPVGRVDESVGGEDVVVLRFRAVEVGPVGGVVGRRLDACSSSVQRYEDRFGVQQSCRIAGNVATPVSLPSAVCSQTAHDASGE